MGFVKFGEGGDFFNFGAGVAYTVPRVNTQGDNCQLILGRKLVLSSITCASFRYLKQGEVVVADEVVGEELDLVVVEKVEEVVEEEVGECLPNKIMGLRVLVIIPVTLLETREEEDHTCMGGG